MDVTIGLGALSKTPTIIRNAGPVLREGAEAATDAFNYVDRGFTPKSADLDINKPNTLTRLVGTGDSGYKDALTSGVIRGNPKPAIGQAREVNKNQRAMRKRGVAEEDIRAYASNNI